MTPGLLAAAILLLVLGFPRSYGWDAYIAVLLGFWLASLVL
jgi:hypothetical protein